jgi:hypothetical protein
MATTVHIEIPDDEQYEWLSDVKDENGMKWRGMLVLAAKELERDR